MFVDATPLDMTLYGEDRVTKLGRPMAVFLIDPVQKRVVRCAASMDEDPSDAITKAILKWIKSGKGEDMTKVLEVDMGVAFTSKKFVKAASNAGYSLQYRRHGRCGGTVERLMGQINRRLTRAPIGEFSLPHLTLAELQKQLSRIVKKHNY
jgi:hypothetical protein